MATYVAELRSLAEFCNFGQTLEAMLRDRIVCGINDDAIQRRLLAEPVLTFKKSLEIAQGLEATARHMRELHPFTFFSCTWYKMLSYMVVKIMFTSNSETKGLTCEVLHIL